MSAVGLDEKLHRFFDLAGISDDAPWLRPPATELQIAGAEDALGFGLPDDLVELLRVHNGGNLIDSTEWIGVYEEPTRGLVGVSNSLKTQAIADLRLGGLLGMEPGPRALVVAGASHDSILYDMDDEPGRLLYCETDSNPAIIPLCRSIAALFDCHIALAEAGFITLGQIGPFVDGPPDEVNAIYVSHHVAAAPMWGTESWLAWPGSADFSID